MYCFSSELQTLSIYFIVSYTVPWTNALMGGGFRLGRGAMLDALRASLLRLQTDSVDLYQVCALATPALTVFAARLPGQMPSCKARSTVKPQAIASVLKPWQCRILSGRV